MGHGVGEIPSSAEVSLEHLDMFECVADKLFLNATGMLLICVAVLVFSFLV